MKNIKHTKILATIGPSSSSPEIIRELIKSGVNLFRINFSHIKEGYDDVTVTIENIRKLGAEEGKVISILGDLQGPKIRTGKLAKGEIILKKGQEIRLTTDTILGTDEMVSTTYIDLPNDVKKNDPLLVDDGLLELKVKKVEGIVTVCEVVVGGVLKNHKGINLPGVSVSSPALSEKDIEDVIFAAKMNLDFIALSFVRNVKDVKDLKAVMKKNKFNIPIITKIEKPEALGQIDEIISESYGLMIARGDLGVEMNPANVPIIQKNLVKECNMKGKPVIIATQMLDSMQINKRPTRAEASDVANAVVDGADCLMLSGETAAGKYPIQTVKTMREIITITEKDILFKAWKDNTEKMRHVNQVKDPMHLICRAAYRISKDIQASLIVVVTHSGSTAIQLSKYRPGVPILALTDNDEALQRMVLSWGLFPRKIDKIERTDEFSDSILKCVAKFIKLPKGSPIIFTAGLPHFAQKTTNTLKIHMYNESEDEPLL